MNFVSDGFKVLCTAGLCAVTISCQTQNQPKFDAGKVRDYANALYNRQLYGQAVREYETYLNEYDLDDKEAANINYVIGDIYFERVRDYENALTYYLRIKYLYPESKLIDDVNRKMVECLERLERSADAQQVLEASVMLDPSEAKTRRPGKVIARIGKREITTGDLDHEISQLPPYIKSQLSSKSQKIDFLRQYIATELLYDTAKRKGLDREQSVVEGTFQAKKNIMVQKLLEEEISQNVDIKESDVELYYKANKDRYSERDESGKIIKTKPFEDVKTQVIQDLISTEQKGAYEQLVQRMMRAEAVVIYEDRLN